MNKLILNRENVEAYKTILMNPSKHGLNFKPLTECFEESDTVIAKHELFKIYVDWLKKPLPKVMFYIIMDEVFGNRIGKDANGLAGYGLKLSVD